MEATRAELETLRWSEPSTLATIRC
jgi:hypothetical protein